MNIKDLLKDWDIFSLSKIDNESLEKFIDEQADNRKLVVAKQLISKLLSEMKKFVKQKYLYKSWDDIVDDYYQDKNIYRRYKLLSSLPIEKGICENLNCSIFPPLIEVAQSIDKLNNIYEVAQAKEKYGKNSAKYREIKLKIAKINEKLTIIFQETHKIFSIQNTQRFTKIQAHQRVIEKLKTMGEMNIPYSKNVGRDIDADYDSDENMLMPNDPKLQETHDPFDREEFLQQIKEEEIKKRFNSEAL